MTALNLKDFACTLFQKNIFCLKKLKGYLVRCASHIVLLPYIAAAAGPAFGGIKGVNQEDEDVSRALEASLLESQGNGKRKRADGNWIDPLNPHDRERNAMV